MSLRARILLLAIGIAVLIIVLAGVPIAVLLRADSYNHTEQTTRDAAQSTADYLSTGGYADDTVVTQYLDRRNERSDERVTVVMPDGDVLGAQLPSDATAAPRGSTAPGSASPSTSPRDPAEEHAEGHGEHDRDPRYSGLDVVSTAATSRLPDGDVLASATVGGPGGQIHVYALTPAHILREEVLRRYLLVIGVAAGLLLIAGAAAEITSRRLVRPLQRTAETAERLSRGDLTARAPATGPADVARVAVELNSLADRIDELLLAERENVADLSHRLRSPLTAVRLSVEALPPGEITSELEDHVANLERTLTQVIHAARRPQREGLHPRSDAVAVAADRAGFWAPLAEDQGRRLDIDLPPGEVPVRAARADLAAALDALIENVLAHTPEGTDLAVRVAQRDGDVTIDVLDRGPGIAADALTRGRSDRGSSGLGLDIARSVAQNTGGALELITDAASGMRGVRMSLS
ncbi:sensor histidine kinase [Gordonia sp. NPDC003376]